MKEGAGIAPRPSYAIGLDELLAVFRPLGSRHLREIRGVPQERQALVDDGNSFVDFTVLALGASVR